MRMLNWVGCIVAAGLGGCSLYPIVDDVGYLRTEDIVLYGRCEVRSALFEHMFDKNIVSREILSLSRDDREKLLKARIQKAKDFEKTKKEPSTDEQEGLRRLAKLVRVAIAYSFDFHITEHNRAAGSTGFKMPWAAANVVDVGAAGAVDLTRVGSRVFGTEDSWEDLIGDFSSKCDDKPWDQRPRTALYPLTGSIGVGNVVRTFIEIEEQGGAKDNFVDTLTFTTDIGGGVDAAVKLEPVPSQFRLVSATASVAASRVDVHKLTVSLAFPQPPAPKAITGVVRVDGDLNAPFERPPAWRARYNLRVQDARTRENAFKQLRLTDPVVYCIAYADQFAPKYGHGKIVVTETRRVRVPGQLGAAPGGPEGGSVRTERRTLEYPVRPNLSPGFQ